MKILRLGSIGPSVQLLQLALERAGFGPVTTDGIFGTATQYALRRFQQANPIPVDGVAGSVTHRALLPWYTGFLIHTAARGDTLYSIAQRHGSTAAALTLANQDIDAASLMPGTPVIVPLPFDVVPTGINYCAAIIGYCVRGLAARYPFIVTGEIGKSVMGRPLWCMSLGRGGNRVLYNASHHANEWITTALLLKFTEELARAYAAGGFIYGQSAAELLDYASLFIVPAVDPDGIDLVTGELTSGEYYEQAAAIAASRMRTASQSTAIAATSLLGIRLSRRSIALAQASSTKKSANDAPPAYAGALPRTTDTLIGLSFCRSTAT